MNLRHQNASAASTSEKQAKMTARLWRTGLKKGRVAAYETFAREISLPMFQEQDGFLGCVMSRDADTGLTACGSGDSTPSPATV